MGRLLTALCSIAERKSLNSKCGEVSSDYRSIQFSTFTSGIFSKCLRLSVTTVSPSLRA